MNLRLGFAVVVSGLALAACGGGGDGSAAPGIPGLGRTTAAQYVAGVYTASTSLKSQCAVPRSGIDPYTRAAYPDKPGTALAEMLWLRSWTNEYYLWYSEVADLDPTPYTTANYFSLLKTQATTQSGKPKDQFHFSYDTATWNALSQSGTDLGYGVEWILRSGSLNTLPRNIVVAYVHTNSPAANAVVPVKRGEKVVSVDGVSVDTLSSQAVYDALFPSSSIAHLIGFMDPNTNTTRTVSLLATQVTLASVQNVKALPTSMGVVGYLQFNDHLAQAESALNAAINSLKTQSISDLVIDMRYNGGGYLGIAGELGYMIGGTVVKDRIFEATQFNSKYPSINPFTGKANTPITFSAVSGGFSLTAGAALPALSLNRVYVLTGPNTCSASESLMNGLRGVGVNVIQIGGTTCGKPYGFYPEDNCGTTYFSIQMQGVNAIGQGGYSDGFTPTNSVQVANPSKLPGCSVADDFNHLLGDPAEARLAAALSYRETGICPTPPVTESVSMGKRAMSVADASEDPASNDGVMLRSPLRENALYR